MANDNEVEREAIKEYGEVVGLIYMVGYMKGKIQGHREAVETYEEHDKGSIFVPKDAGQPLQIRKIKV